MRSIEGLKLTNTPLVLVLSQIRFSEVLKMDKFVPDIQEAFKELGLSRFTQAESQQFIFGPKLKTKASTRWVFSDRKKTEAVILSNDFFVYQVSKYDVFDTFSERLDALLKKLVGIVGIEFAERVGLRYLDLIIGDDEHPVDSFISDSLQGLSAEALGVDKANHQFVINAQTECGTLLLRSFENSGGQFLPPDLQSPHLEFEVELKPEAEFRVLDFDHIAQGDLDFEGDVVKETLWKLHKFTDLAFRAAVTPTALKIWKGESDD